MEYTINSLAKLAGISTRTLRYYDNIELLKPARITEAGYRIYGAAEVDTLQQILLYKSMGFELAAIKWAMSAPLFDRASELAKQKRSLEQKRLQLNSLIKNIEKTIESEKGKLAMTDTEKFDGLKKQFIEENERVYGAEVREKYGEKMADESNARMMKLTEQQYGDMQKLGADIKQALKEAVRNAENPNGDTGKTIAQMHREWLGYTWGSYSREAHIGLGEMYVADERFKPYYDTEQEGCAEFLRNAINSYI